ncbi:hypothetical protein [Skermanella aerolata]|nr:hypothetical protein [Skermanella aerolata]
MSGPAFIFAMEGLKLSGGAEESVGYRYFYSLRLLYGQNEAPWLPQGQLIGLLHQALQLALSAAGFPVADLGDRVELFSYLSALLAACAGAAAFLFAARELRSAIGTWALAAALVTCAYSLRSGGGYHLVLPDYYAWVMPLGLVGLALALRVLNEQTIRSAGPAIRLGVYAALCAAMKLTFLVFPIIVALLMLPRFRAPGVFGRSIGSAVLVAAAVLFGVTVLVYHGDHTAIGRHFDIAEMAALQTSAAESLWQRLEVNLFGNPLDLATLALVWPVLLVLSLVFMPNRPVTAALLPSSILSAATALQRFYPPTLIEVNMAFLVALTIWLSAVGIPYLRQRFAVAPIPLRLAPSVVLVLLGLAGITGAARFFDLFTPAFRAATEAAGVVDAFVHAGPGRTVVLIPFNDLRPTTIDTALAKGGTDVHLDTNVNVWGVSPLVHGLVKDRDFLISVANADIRPNEYERLVFVTYKGRTDEILKLNAERFQFNPDLFECAELLGLGSAPFNFFLPAVKAGRRFTSDFTPYAPDQERVLVGCRKRPVTGVRKAADMVSNALLVGGRMYSLQDGRLFETVGTEGQETTLTFAGSIRPESRRFAGLNATYRDGQWTVDRNAPFISPLTFTPFVPDPDLSSVYKIAPPSRFTRVDDGDSTFYRIFPARGSAHDIGIYTYFHRLAVDRLPMAIRAVVRAPKGKIVSIQAYDFRDAGDRTRIYERQAIATGDWQTLLLNIDNLILSNDDFYSIRLMRMIDKDTFDVMSVEAGPGVLPE